MIALTKTIDKTTTKDINEYLSNVLNIFLLCTANIAQKQLGKQILRVTLAVTARYNSVTICCITTYTLIINNIEL